MSNHLDMSWRQKIGIYGILISNVTTYLSSRDQFNKKYNMGQATVPCNKPTNHPLTESWKFFR